MDKKQLTKSVVLALSLGIVVLVTAVLPAEYGIDPLGTGKLLGFSRLYMEETTEEPIQNSKQADPLNRKKLTLEELGSPPNIPKPIEANDPPQEKQFEVQNDTIKVVVKADKGIEYKFSALKYASVKYEWTTSDNNIVFIDFHGEVKQDNPPEEVFYESYTLAYSNNMAGTFTAPFEGRHGWYFRNRSNEDITVTIRLKGQYQLFDN